METIEELNFTNILADTVEMNIEYPKIKYKLLLGLIKHNNDFYIRIKYNTHVFKSISSLAYGEVSIRNIFKDIKDYIDNNSDYPYYSIVLKGTFDLGVPCIAELYIYRHSFKTEPRDRNDFYYNLKLNILYGTQNSPIFNDNFVCI